MAVFAVTDKLFIYADQPTELLFQLDNLWIFHNVLTHLPIFRAGSNLRPRQITAFCSVAKLCVHSQLHGHVWGSLQPHACMCSMYLSYIAPMPSCIHMVGDNTGHSSLKLVPGFHVHVPGNDETVAGLVPVE